MRKPDWLKVKILNEDLSKMEAFLRGLNLNSVCQSANCPNIGECFARRTATFMIMGDVCTRNCRFCAVEKGKPLPLDDDEPRRVAEATKRLDLKHVVVTCVTRDDLPDGGALHFEKTIFELKKLPGVTIEVLVSDFMGNIDSIATVVNAKPDIINHNVETVPRLYEKVRPKADYQRSLNLLKKSKEFDGNILTKSGMMVGLGETQDEVIQVMKDLREIDCDMLTIGQYLRPSLKHIEVVEYITPQKFKEYEEIGYELGFKYVASGPLVRSSYHADEGLQAAKS
ncbi:MAG: lipoyl synthase [Thermoanaerobacteraceae bacterium]